MNLSADDHASPTLPPWAGLSSRLAFLGYFTSVALVCVLVFFALSQRDASFLAGAVIAGGLALGLRVIVRERDGKIYEQGIDFEECENGCDRPMTELARLLRELERIEQTRGSRSFDPWELQGVRSEIREVVRDYPALWQLFKSGV
jgi:hypothetical protein